MSADKLDPAERARFEFENALADAYQRGRQEGRGEVLRLLTLIVTATNETMRLAMIANAQRELQKWGV